MKTSQFWQLSHRADPPAVTLADRHYSRQKPGTNQFMPAGRALVLITPEHDAVFGISWPFPEYCNRPTLKSAWNCSIFRNESKHLASAMICEAVAIARFIYGENPDGMVTYVDASQVKSRNPGYCFKKAGFVTSGLSTKGYVQLHLSADKISDKMMPQRYQMRLAI